MSNSTLLLLLVFGLGTLASCTSDDKAANDELAALEAEARSSQSPEAIGALINAYEAEMAKRPDDNATNSAYLRTAAEIMYDSGRFAAAADLIQRSLREYPHPDDVPATALYLGKMFEEKLGAREAALSTYQALQNTYPQSTEAQAIQAQVVNLPPLQTRLDTLLSRMVDPQTGRADSRIAQEYISSVENYLLLDPTVENAPNKLYMAAEVARSIRQHQQALEFYDWIIADFTDFDRLPKAYFMRAFTLDEDLKQDDAAREAYETFIARYPNDDFADDAQALLNNIGKTDEEIFQEFEQKRREQEGG